jgi:O-antigen/teichoic acid export membrane protein
MILYLALIPRFATTGAVTATLVSETIVALVAWMLLVSFQRREDAPS